MKIEKLLEKFKAQLEIEWIEEEEGGRPRAKTFRGRRATDERTKDQGGWTKDDWKPATSN